MRCIAQSNEMPLTIQVERRNNIYDIWLRQNIHEVEVQDELTPYSYYEYDEAYMQADSEPEITAENFSEWFTVAEEWEETDTEPIPEPTVSDLLLEIAADHEERICMIELMSEV